MNTGSVNTILFNSEALQEELKLFIYVPANYSPLENYNILIASDGNDYFQLGGITRLADNLIDNYEIENVIIVGIPYKNVEDRRRKYIPTGDLHEAYCTFLAHELVPYLDEQYATYKNARNRGLIGDSMAATVSLMTAIQYPHIFGKVIMQSPYVDDLVLKKVANFKEVDRLRIYHIIGTQEHQVITKDKTIQDFLTPNRELHDLMNEKGYNFFYDEFNGNHTWKYWKPDLKRALIENFG